jgi:ABC-2 type transport system ATP-binding protein
LVIVNMIEVNRLSRRFGSFKAVEDVSFAVGNGEIVGLLGPNGAGKTTTMRMLTTFLTPTSGRATLAGHDVLDEPLEVRRKLGYLPESVPLYGEMRVREFLRFRARLKDVPRSNLRRAMSEVIARCRLEEVENRVIGQLSRGFRQRVGLAEALIHDPPILILDEPTSGLDPIQILEVRALIRELGARHTILLSTHILPEVEAVCGRVIIIARGRIAVDEQLEDLRRDTAIVVEAHGPADAIRGAIQTVPGVERVAAEHQDTSYAEFRVHARDGRDLREAIGQKLVSGGWPLRRLDLRRSSLEERFIQAVNRETLADARREAS